MKGEQAAACRVEIIDTAVEQRRGETPASISRVDVNGDDFGDGIRRHAGQRNDRADRPGTRRVVDQATERAGASEKSAEGARREGDVRWKAASVEPRERLGILGPRPTNLSPLRRVGTRRCHVSPVSVRPAFPAPRT